MLYVKVTIVNSPHQEDNFPPLGWVHHCNGYHGCQGTQSRSQRSCLDWRACWYSPGSAWLLSAVQTKKKSFDSTNLYITYIYIEKTLDEGGTSLISPFCPSD